MKYYVLVSWALLCGWEVEVKLRAFVSVTLLTELYRLFEVSCIGSYIKCKGLSVPYHVPVHYSIEAYGWHVGKRILLIDIGFTWR